MRHASPCGAPGALLPPQGALFLFTFCSKSLAQTSNPPAAPRPALSFSPGRRVSAGGGGHKIGTPTPARAIARERGFSRTLGQLVTSKMALVAICAANTSEFQKTTSERTARRLSCARAAAATATEWPTSTNPPGNAFPTRGTSQLLPSWQERLSPNYQPH